MIIQNDLWTSFLTFLDSGKTLDIFGWNITLYRLLALLISIVLLFLILQIAKRWLYRIVKLNAFPTEFYNGILFVLRLVFGIFLIWVILTFLNINSSYILILSGLVATAIAFASVKTINNFVAGIYIAVTSPYSLGDYVKIGSTEGIVVKITSFYTQIRSAKENIILIPNLNCISSNILNYTIDIQKSRKKLHDLKKKEEKLRSKKSKKLKKSNEVLLKKLQSEITEKEIILENFDTYQSKLNSHQEMLKNAEYLHRNKVTRYIFDLELPKQWDSIEKNVQQACQKWNDTYHFHVEGVLVNITAFFVYEFTVFTQNPMDILQYYPELLTDLYQSIYRVN